MKAWDRYFALLGFNLRLLPRNFLFLFVIFCFNASFPGILAIVFLTKAWDGDTSGIGTSLNVFPLMFSGLLGLQFFIRDTGWAGTAEKWVLPAGEFIVTRPVSRQAAYFTRMFLYFIILLLPSLLNVGLTTVEPDLRISLYHSHTQSTEGADKLKLYQSQFPNSAVIRASKTGHNTLIIPFGAVLIALWQLWLTLLLAMALQAITLLTLPSKIQIGLFMAIGIAPIFLITFRLVGDSTMILENIFFFFVRYWVLVTLFTLGAVAFIQERALKQIQELDVL